MNYPDLEFTLSLLLRAEQTPAATRLLRDLAFPLVLSPIHRLQIENGLLRGLHSSNRQIATSAQVGLLLWGQYLLEEVFTIQSFDLEEACVRATAWNAEYTVQPPKWSLLIHPALAIGAASTFMSFNPALRKLAMKGGLQLLPLKL